MEEQAHIASVNVAEELARKDQQLERLRQAYLDLQEQAQQLQQQQQNRVPDDAQLNATRDRIFKMINHMPTFTGTGEVTVNSFFSGTEYLLSTILDENIKKDAVRTIFYKVIQGQAKDVVINIPTPDDWQLIKETLKLRYRPNVEPHQLYRMIANLKVNTIWTTLMLILTGTPIIRGMMTTKLLTEQTGFIDIYMKNQEIVNESDIILHIVNLNEIEHILDKITENIILMELENKNLLQLELMDTRNKLMTLIPKQNRQRRGLINGIGSMSKWLFGTMDEEDRQNIQNHLLQVKGIMESNNQQILINDYFNDTLNHLKLVISSDRQTIEKEINSISKLLETENKNNIYLEQMTNIQLLKNKIEQLQDNIISAQHNIVHPNILTSYEIQKYEIDYNKLKYIQLGTAVLNNSNLIFCIKIPKTFEIVKLRSIVPIPNKDKNEIDYNIEQIFEWDDKIYKFEENKHMKDLKISTHCIIKNDCQLMKHKDFEILELSVDTILIKNAENININQTCNSEKIVLNGNYLISYSNCSIRIKDYYLSNIVENVKQKQIINTIEIIKNFTNKITLEQIEQEHQYSV